MEVIKKKAKFVRETFDMNKSIVLFGEKEKQMRNRMTRDKEEMKKIYKK